MIDDSDRINAELAAHLATECPTQFDSIIKKGRGDIDPGFLGFVETYFYLSKIIPKDRIVYDMGCCYAPQAYYFKDHAGYVGVDANVAMKNRFKFKNTKHFRMTIEEFVLSQDIDYIHFAIINYVPPWHVNMKNSHGCSCNEELVRKYFHHMFVYYGRSKKDDLIKVRLPEKVVPLGDHS